MACQFQICANRNGRHPINHKIADSFVKFDVDQPNKPQRPFGDAEQLWRSGFVITLDETTNRITFFSFTTPTFVRSQEFKTSVLAEAGEMFLFDGRIVMECSQSGVFHVMFGRRKVNSIQRTNRTEDSNDAVKSSFLLSFLESVPELAGKLPDPHSGERKFEDVVKDAQQASVLVY